MSKTDAMDKWKPDHNAQSVEPMFYHLWLFSLVVCFLYTLDILFGLRLELVTFISNSDTY